VSQWQYLADGIGQGGSTTVGGGGTPLAGFRSILDARRSMSTGQVPSAAYPDGYLGNINSRREDKLLQHVQNRLTQRSYQRGVHKGERIDPRDYYWTDDVNPQAGLQAEARGLRWTQQGTPAEQINHMGKNHLLSPDQVARTAAGVGVKAPQQIDPIRQQRMSRLLPNWR
jgi:hypothetical protein